jgi:hypothetical protein
MAGRNMYRCRVCGFLFAYRWAGERYCSTEQCQAAKQRRRHRSSRKTNQGEPTVKHSSSGMRAAQLDASAALVELRAWVARERAQW